MNVIRKLFPHQRQHGADNGIRLFSADKQKVFAALAKRNPFTIVDPVGIDDNVTLGCLTEDPGQLHYIKGPGGDQVTQHIARTNTRKLVGIPHQDQAGSGVHCPKKCMHQINIHHGHLINDDSICIQRILLIALKMHA